MTEVRTGRRATDNPKILRPKSAWQEHTGGVYRCMVYLTPEEEGFSVAAAHLPGVASQGRTEQEALARIVDAFEKVIALCKEKGADIPWSKTPIEPERGAATRWVIVHA